MRKVRAEDAVEGLGKINEGDDTGELMIYDLFNKATESKNVFTCSTSRAEAVLIVAKFRLNVFSDTVE